MCVVTYNFLVTRECVPKAILNDWRPSVSSNKDSVSNETPDIEDSSSDGERSSPFMYSLQVPFPLSQRPRRNARTGSEDEVEQDVISISTGVCLSDSL